MQHNFYEDLRILHMTMIKKSFPKMLWIYHQPDIDHATRRMQLLFHHTFYFPKCEQFYPGPNLRRYSLLIT